jgi:hypothetical protein
MEEYFEIENSNLSISKESLNDAIETSVENDDVSSTIQSKIKRLLNETIEDTLNHLITEFLTFNLFKFIKIQMRCVLLEKIHKNNVKIESLKEFFELNKNLLENEIRNELLDEETFLCLYKEAKINLEMRTKKLEKTILEHLTIQYQKIFTKLNRIKFKLSISNKILKQISDYKKSDANEDGDDEEEVEEDEEERINSMIYQIENDPDKSTHLNDAEIQREGFKYFKNFTICKIFCETLVFKQDLNEKSACCCLSSFKDHLIRDGSIGNKIIKTLTGIVFSWLLIIPIYLYLRFIMKINSTNAAIFLTVTFFVLIFGLSFNNKKFRSIVMLMFPMFATNRGKGMIILCCVSLASAYIIPNIFVNIKWLQMNYMCNMQLIESYSKQRLKQTDIYHLILNLINDLKYFSETVHKTMSTLKRFLIKISGYFKKAFAMLSHLSAICSGSFGDVFKVCFKILNGVIEKCRQKTSIFSFVCEVLYLFTYLCAQLQFVSG